MARLPDKTNLSGPASLRSGRAVASLDTTGIGRGIAAAGNALAGLGEAMRQRQDVTDVARAEAFKTEGLLGVQNAFEADGDYSTFQKRAPKQTADVVQRAAGLIRNPSMRERWTLSARTDAAKFNDAIFDRGAALGRQAETNAFDDALERSRRLFVEPVTPDDVKQRARGDIEGAISQAEANGLLTPDQADARRRAFLEDADFSRGQLAVQADPDALARGGDWYDRLSPERRAELQKEAQRVRVARSVEGRAALEVVVQNAPVAIENTGQYGNMLPTAEQFTAAYGPMEGAQRFTAFQSAVEVGRAVYDMRTMPAADIRATIDAAKPVSSGDDAALQSAEYATLSKAAETTLKQRNEDPARYVQNVIPSVRKAWEGANSPAGYEAALAATAAAQEQLGIADVRLLPAGIADGAVNRFKDVTLPEEQRLAGAVELMMAATRKDHRRAIFDQLVEAGLPDMTEGAFDAMARGDRGAARRLFQASMIDPTNLPGVLAPGDKAFALTDIDDAVQRQFMDEGEIGDVFYGLNDGNVENFARAGRDAKLLRNAVLMRLKEGEQLDRAVIGATGDLVGKVRVVNGNSRAPARLLLSEDDDEKEILGGLSVMMSRVREAMESSLAVPSEVQASDGTRAVMGAATRDYIDNVLTEGGFRNAEGGFVFLDPFTGTAVAGPDGKPLVLRMEDVRAAAIQAVDPAVMETERERDFIEQRARQFGIMGGSR